MGRQKKEEEVAEKEVDQIDAILNEKAFKGLHYGSRSGDEIEKPDVISTGSFIFDTVLEGGFRSSTWSRFYAFPEHGKTAQGLFWGVQWQKYYEKKGMPAMVIPLNAEGRITPDLILRSGLDTSKHKFRMIDSNNADFIFTFIERLTQNNPDDIRYYFLLDSTDACIRSFDIGKTFAEPEKMAGSSAIYSAAGKRLSLLFNRTGHHLYATSQLRDNMNGGKPQPAGGKALLFYSSLSGGMIPHWSDFEIRENPSDKKSKAIGRKVQIRLDKTYNEATGIVVEVPVQYGRVGGVWREYEAMLMAIEWKVLQETSVGRFQFSESFCEELKQNNVEFEEKFHGEKAIRTYFDTNPPLVEFIFFHVSKLRGF